MIFKRRRQRACQQARLWLTQRAEDGLADKTAVRLETHLADCPACRDWSRRADYLDGRLLAEQPAYHRLTPADAAHIRSRVHGRIWRKSIMLQTRQALQGAATLIVLAALTAVFIFWQRQTVQPLLEATPPAVTETEQVTLTLAVDGSALPRYRPLIDAFEQENEEIRVRLVSLDEVADPGESGIRALATSFDVFAYSPNRQGDTQFLLDLRPLLALDPAFDANDFLPGLLPPDSEPLWAVPTGAAYYLTFFDKSAFDAAGLPYPELDWTAEEFLTAAQTLTLRENDNVTQWGYVPGQMRYPTLLAARLTGPLDSGDSLRLTDPDVATAVQWVSDLFTVHQVAPWLDEYRPVDRRVGGDQTPTGLINSGMAAMWHTTHLLYDENDSDVGVTAVPRGQRGFSAEPIVYGLAVSRGANNPQAAWRLLDYLSRQPPQDIPPIFAAPVPARQSVATATNYWEQTPADLAAVLQYTAENNAAPRLTYPAVEALQQAIAAHIDDDLPVAVALDQLPAQPTEPTETEEIVVIAPSPPPDDDRETVRIVFATENGLLEAHRRLVNQFQRESSGITVQIEAREVFASHALDRVAGSDCFVGEPSFFWHDDDARAGILPLTPLLEVDGALRPDDFYPALIEAMMADGELWGIPAWIHPPYLEYNRELFAEAGIPTPPLDWTLDDFLNVARQLSVGEGETKQYAYAEFAPLFALGSLQAFGADVVDNSAAVPDFNYEATAEMIAWHVDLVRLHQAQPLIGDMSTSDMDEFETLLRSGRLAMWFGGGSAIPVMRTGPLNFDVGVAAQPIGPGGYRGNVSQITPTAYHIAVTADSSRRQACWQWIKFLAAQPTAVQVQTSVSSGRMMPAHIQAAESEAYVSLVGAEMAAVFQDFLNFPAVAGAPAMPQSPPWMRPGHDWLRDAYWEAVTGDVGVTAALANAEAKFSQYRQCVIDQDAFEDTAAWQACALSVDPSLSRFYAR